MDGAADLAHPILQPSQGAMSETSASTDQATGNKNIATVYVCGALGKHLVRKCCYCCERPLELEDQVMCCFYDECESIYCKSCLMNNKAHKEHWPYMKRMKTLAEYLKPG